MLEISLNAPIGRKSQKFTSSILSANLQSQNNTRLTKAYLTGISKASQEIRFMAIEELSKATGCPIRHIQERVKAEKVTPYNPRGNVQILSKRIALKYFQPKQTRNGVRVKVGKRTKTYSHAFMPRKLQGHVMQRVGLQKLPIRKVPGVSLPRIARLNKIDSMLLEHFHAKAKRYIKQNMLLMIFGQ